MARLSSPGFYSSPLSQFCDEQLPGDFHFLDGDEVVLRYSSQPISFARETRILRVFESKSKGEEIRRSQRDVLPLLALAIRLAVEHGDLATGSGVFIIEGTPPYLEGACLSQVRPFSHQALGIETLGPRQISRSEVEVFIRCRNLERAAAA